MSKEIATWTGAAPRIQEDPTYWRRMARDAGVAGIDICPKCEDTGFVPSYKWCDYDDWVQCPLCSHHTGPMTNYPMEDDGMEVPF